MKSKGEFRVNATGSLEIECNPTISEMHDYEQLSSRFNC